VYVILSKQKMRTVTNIFLLNLAISDLSFLVICPPFTAYQMAAQVWPFGAAACKLMHYLLNVTVYVTIYTLVFISIIRYLTVCHNAKTMQFRTKKNMIIIIITIWIAFLAFNIPILFSYGIQMYGGEPACEILGDKLGQQLYATFFTFAYILPLAIIAVLSVGILQHLHKQKSNMLDKQKRKSNSRNKQASRILVLVVVIFAIFWLPVHIHLLVAYFGEMSDSRVYQAISVMWNCLAYFNSCVNPIIYNYASQEFRDAFSEAMCCDLPAGAAGRGVQGDSKRGAGTEHTMVSHIPEENGKEKLLAASPDETQTENDQL
jgi:allatostatin receptor